MNEQSIPCLSRRVGRRALLQLGAATVAVAALDACSRFPSASGTTAPVPSASGSTSAVGSVAPTIASGSAAVTTPSATRSAATSVAPASVTSAVAGSRPNIIFINTDDLDTASLPTMPKLKSLMTDQGTTCSNFFVTVSLCCPSRSTFLRGQYAHNTQVLTNGGDNGGFARAHALGIENSTVATWLQAAGYHTGLMGKYLNGYPSKDVPETYIPPGWNEWSSPVEGNAYSEFGYKMNENGKVVAYGNTPQDYMTDVLSGKAADFIKRAAGAPAPFFLYIATYAPHQPATPAPKYANAFPDAKAPHPPSYNEQDVSDKPQWIQHLPLLSDKEQAQLDEIYRKRIETLQSVDDLLENVVNTLQATGKLDNTYIVFSSDNGFHLGEHREAAGKQAPYEGDIRLPLIVRGPGIAAGKTMDQLVGNVDFAPTFAQWAGASVPDFVDGRSFAPLLTGATPDAWRQAFLIEHFSQAGAVKSKGKNGKQGKNGKNGKHGTAQPAATAQATPGVTIGSAAAGKSQRAKGTRAVGSAAAVSGTSAPKATSGNKGIPEFHGLRAKAYVYVEYVTKERELYDLTKDPDELQNIAGSADSALLAQLAARLADLQKGAGATLRTAEQQPMPSVH
ncbi:MAG: sulfatase-like hydrolase/transferase [Thermomicrobiales bacterium]